jgi:hypothetical protein
MKTFKQIVEETVLNEGGESYPADDMTMKEIKIACYAARNILDRLEDGQPIQRWQISAIVKAKEELASVYTSLSADEDEWEDDYEEEPMYVGFEYPRMYGEEADVDESSFVAKAAHSKVAGKKTFKLKGSDEVHPVTIQHHHAHKIKKSVSEETDINEGPFKGIGKFLMKRKLQKQVDAHTDNMYDNPKEFGDEYDRRSRKQKALSRLKKEEAEHLARKNEHKR